MAKAKSKPMPRRKPSTPAPAATAPAPDILATVDPPQPQPVGPYRPLGWKRPDYRDVGILQADINQYLERCEEAKHLPSITGLCCWLDIDEDTFGSWERVRTRSGAPMDYFIARVGAVKAARARILAAWTNRLQAQGQAAGAIFYLKNAFGWRDIQEISVTAVVAALTDSELAYRLASAHQDLAALLPPPPDDVPSRMEGQVIDVPPSPVADHNGR